VLDHRCSQGKVSFAGPYFIAGQDLLVRADDTTITGVDSLAGKETLLGRGLDLGDQRPEEGPGRQPAGVQHLHALRGRLKAGNVDALTTDDTILAGYAAQEANKGKLKVVGKTFSTENYGVGLKKGDVEFCKKVTDAITKYISGGEWQKAVDKNSARPATSPAPATRPPRRPAPDPAPPARYAVRPPGRTAYLPVAVEGRSHG
ncbi:MAG: transporter substrate-binding domain-containing protein, partial [Actinomycetales bacterium]|nr:transporter substrate-binding domain-containing protein [Actinomycetales bacterium]